MKLTELQDRLHKNSVPHSGYSLDEGLKGDAYIIQRKFLKWQFFYLDERGERSLFKEFRNVEDAYDLLWERIEVNLRMIPPSIPRE